MRLIYLRIAIILFLALLIAAALTFFTPREPGNLSVPPTRPEIIDTSRPSVVSVWAVKDDRAFNQGSGFIVSADGLILTSFHVVKDAETIFVRFDRAYSDQRADAELVASNIDFDVALLRLKGDGYTPLPLTPFKVRQGDMVLAMGYPDSPGGSARDMTVTSGIVSRIGRDELGAPLIVQTDAYITNGSSGGPLYDANTSGVVGICTWSQHDENNSPIPGINYALSIEKAVELFAEYLE